MSIYINPAIQLYGGRAGMNPQTEEGVIPLFGTGTPVTEPDSEGPNFFDALAASFNMNPTQRLLRDPIAKAFEVLLIKQSQRLRNADNTAFDFERELRSTEGMAPGRTELAIDIANRGYFDGIDTRSEFYSILSDAAAAQDDVQTIDAYAQKTLMGSLATGFLAGMVDPIYVAPGLVGGQAIRAGMAGGQVLRALAVSGGANAAGVLAGKKIIDANTYDITNQDGWQDEFVALGMGGGLGIVVPAGIFAAKAGLARSVLALQSPNLTWRGTNSQTNAKLLGWATNWGGRQHLKHMMDQVAEAEIPSVRMVSAGETAAGSLAQATNLDAPFLPMRSEIERQKNLLRRLLEESDPKNGDNAVFHDNLFVSVIKDADDDELNKLVDQVKRRYKSRREKLTGIIEADESGEIVAQQGQQTERAIASVIDEGVGKLKPQFVEHPGQVQYDRLKLLTRVFQRNRALQVLESSDLGRLFGSIADISDRLPTGSTPSTRLRRAVTVMSDMSRTLSASHVEFTAGEAAGAAANKMSAEAYRDFLAGKLVTLHNEMLAIEKTVPRQQREAIRREAVEFLYDTMNEGSMEGPSRNYSPEAQKYAGALRQYFGEMYDELVDAGLLQDIIRESGTVAPVATAALEDAIETRVQANGIATLKYRRAWHKATTGRPITVTAWHAPAGSWEAQLTDYARERMGRNTALGDGWYGARDRDIAETFGTPEGFNVTLNNPFVFSESSQRFVLYLTNEKLQSIRAAGHDGIIVKGVDTGLVSQDRSHLQILAFDPEQAVKRAEIIRESGTVAPASTRSTKTIAQTQTEQRVAPYMPRVYDSDAMLRNPEGAKAAVIATMKLNDANTGQLKGSALVALLDPRKSSESVRREITAIVNKAFKTDFVHPIRPGELDPLRVTDDIATLPQEGQPKQKTLTADRLKSMLKDPEYDERLTDIRSLSPELRAIYTQEAEVIYRRAAENWFRDMTDEASQMQLYESVAGAGKPTSLMSRKFQRIHPTLLPYMLLDPVQLTRRYNAQVAGHIAIARMMREYPEVYGALRTLGEQPGTRREAVTGVNSLLSWLVDAENSLVTLETDLNRQGIGSAKSNRLAAATFKREITDTRAIVKRLIGQTMYDSGGRPSEGSMWFSRQVSRSSLVVNGGMMGVSNLGDTVSMSVFTILNPIKGLPLLIESVTSAPLFRNLNKSQSRRMLELMHMGSQMTRLTREDTDYILNQRGFGGSEFARNVTGQVDRATEGGARFFSDVIGLNMVNDWTRRWATLIDMQETIDAARKLALGKTLKPTEMARANRLGIDASNAKTVMEQIHKHGLLYDGSSASAMPFDSFLRSSRIVHPMLDTWDSETAALQRTLVVKVRESARRFRNVTPSVADRPLIEDKFPLMRLVNQFSAFITAYNNQKLRPMAQMQMKELAPLIAAQVFNGWMLRTTSLALSDRRNYDDSVRALVNDPVSELYGAIQQGAVLGNVMRTLGYLDNFNIGPSRALGVTIPSGTFGSIPREAGVRNVSAFERIGAMVGAGPQLLTRMIDIPYSFAKNDSSKWYRLKQILPFQNYVGSRLIHKTVGPIEILGNRPPLLNPSDTERPKPRTGLRPQ